MPGKGRRLLIVEDELLMLGLLQQEFDRLNFNVRTARSVTEARKLIADFDPDIALLDISLDGGPSGLHLGHILARSRPDVAQVYLTKHESASDATGETHGLPAGAGYVRKHAIGDTDYLISVIDEVVAGQAAAPKLNRPEDSFADIQPRAVEVLELLANGCSNQFIAEQLGLSVKAVERWIDVIYKSFGIRPGASRNARVEAALIFHRTMGTHELPVGP